MHTRRHRWFAHCRCGDSIDIRSPHLDVIVGWQEFWEKYHRMEGCGPVSPAQAAAAGRKKRQSELSS